MRTLVASQPATFDNKLAESTALWDEQKALWGLLDPQEPAFAERSVHPAPTWANLEETLEGLLLACQAAHEAYELTDNPAHRHYCVIQVVTTASMLSVMSHHESYPKLLGFITESDAVKAIDAYDFDSDNPVHKAIGMRFDLFLFGLMTPILGLTFGAVDACRPSPEHLFPVRACNN